MAITELEKRVTRLEAEVERLKLERPAPTPVKKPWWEEIRGTFKDDPAYVEAMRLGREWRQSQQLDEGETAS
jgi:hypothetical protein